MSLGLWGWLRLAALGVVLSAASGREATAQTWNPASGIWCASTPPGWIGSSAPCGSGAPFTSAAAACSFQHSWLKAGTDSVDTGPVNEGAWGSGCSFTTWQWGCPTGLSCGSILPGGVTKYCTDGRIKTVDGQCLRFDEVAVAPEPPIHVPQKPRPPHRPPAQVVRLGFPSCLSTAANILARPIFRRRMAAWP